MLRIQSLPTRYEPLAELFGSQTPSTFVKNDADLEEISRLLSRAESGHQGKILFLFSLSGAGKSTLIESLSVFLSSKVERVERLPDDSELPVEGSPSISAGNRVVRSLLS